MTIWITRARDSGDIRTFSAKPYMARCGNWYVDGKADETISRKNAKRILGDQRSLDGPFCFSVEIGAVKRVRTKEDVIVDLQKLLDKLNYNDSRSLINEVITLIENQDQ